MNIMTLLEQLANSAHHKVSVEELISSQPLEIQNVFISNNGSQLKKILGNHNCVDRSSVVQIKK